MNSDSDDVPCAFPVTRKTSSTTARNRPMRVRENSTANCCILAITGATNSGKTTMAEIFKTMLQEHSVSVQIIHQDDFFKQPEKSPSRQSFGPDTSKAVGWISKTVQKFFHGKSPPDEKNPDSFYYNYDEKDAVDIDSFVKTINRASEENEYVIIEGNMLTEFTELLELCDRIVVLTIDYKTCQRRRDKRYYDPPDSAGYFDDLVWPAYLKHMEKAFLLAREDPRFSFVDVSSESDVVNKEEIIDRIKMLSDDVIRITYETLEVEEVMRIINSPSCGATSFFVGTTRDTFQGRQVERLDYESYDEMAYKELRTMCRRVHENYPTIEKMVIFHRIGEVAVGEASVIIATASPHRTEAINATEMAIDELKKNVPIWKKEIYCDGGCSWKENGEFKSMKDHKLSTEESSFSQALRNRDANRNLFYLRQFMKQVSQSEKESGSL